MSKRSITAVVTPPTAKAPKHIVIGLCHLEGLRIGAITVNGVPHRDFDPDKECVALAPSDQLITVRAEYK